MEQKSVLIGMSGGVDSSVAAALLKEQGYHVIGATMRLWTYSDSCNMKHEGCCAESAVEDARRVCDKLGIDFYVMNFKDMFKDKVVDYFVDEYIHGRTPNPCIACNKYLKFDALLKKALAMGIDYVATGHYAKIEKGEDGKYILRASEAVKKDQSYVLYNFTQEQLAHTLMPLGGYNKDWVRQKAEELGLGVAHKPDSQEICFVEDDDYSGITFPGGHVERGESFTDAVIREVWEETGLKISEPKLCGIKDWMKDEETRYIVLLYKTDKFEGIVTSSEEGDVFWLTLDEMKQRKLAYGMDKMLEVFLNDDISEYFFFEENGKWIEELK